MPGTVESSLSNRLPVEALIIIIRNPLPVGVQKIISNSSSNMIIRVAA